MNVAGISPCGGSRSYQYFDDEGITARRAVELARLRDRAICNRVAYYEVREDTSLNEPPILVARAFAEEAETWT